MSFLLEGKECECDLDYRCDNHDDDAEYAYWHGLFVGTVTQSPDEWHLAYEKGDPKAFEVEN